MHAKAGRFFWNIGMVAPLFVLLLNLPLMAVVEESFIKARKIAAAAPIRKYPYDDLVHQLKIEGKTSLLIFTYGSLMDVSSARQTFGEETMATRKPAVAFGLRRIFDRDIAITSSSKWCIPNSPKARAMLNVIPSRSFDDFINGILYDVKLFDLPKMLEREIGYNLIPVVVQEWNLTTETGHKEHLVAYTFHAPQNSRYTNDTILPRPHYYELSRDATSNFGLLFYLTWLKTTYMADGITPISEWEMQVVEKAPHTQAVCQ